MIVTAVINKDKFDGCFFGSIVGDALGMSYEFKHASDIQYEPVMKAGGPFKLPKGCWTDDTSMMLCLAESLIEKKGFDAQHQLLKYLSWYEEGYNSAIGGCFDIGNQTKRALLKFKYNFNLTVAAEEKFRAGNGALMRINPLPLVFANAEDLATFAEASTITTHNNEECTLYSKLYCSLIHEQLLTTDKITPRSAPYGNCDGYVRDSYYLAIDAFNNTKSFAECMEYVIKKGGDTDTNACIAGMLAGAYYGFDAIPKQWVADLIDTQDLRNTCEKLYQLRLELNGQKS